MVGVDGSPRPIRVGPSRIDRTGSQGLDPPAHGRLIERTFGETRRRVKVIGRLPGEHSCTSLVWAVLDRASAGWRGFTMTAAGLRRLQDLRRSLLETPAELPPRAEPAQPAAGSPAPEAVRSA